VTAGYSLPASMRAAVVKDGAFAIREVPVPSPAAGDLLVKVEAASLCGTDLRILRAGHRKMPAGTERVLGHEFAGVVVKASPAAGDLFGKRVAVAPNIGCGECHLCRRGLTNLCPDYQALGIGLDGAFAQYVRVPAEAVSQGNVVPLPDELSWDAGALNEPLSCVIRGLEATGMKPGESVLIFGAGPIGLMFLRLARLLGAGQVILVQRSASRRELAPAGGADLLLDFGEDGGERMQEAVLETTGNRGVDVAIVAAPVAEAQTAALKLLAVGGRLNLFGGLPPGRSLTQMDANLIHYRELVVTGTTGQTVAQYRRGLDLQARGLRLDDLITARYPLQAFGEALAAAADKTGLKVMVNPNQ